MSELVTAETFMKQASIGDTIIAESTSQRWELTVTDAYGNRDKIQLGSHYLIYNPSFPDQIQIKLFPDPSAESHIITPATTIRNKSCGITWKSQQTKHQ